ncbi:reverse transcriptase domain-containing protein [Tanacetum coccineum]
MTLGEVVTNLPPSTPSWKGLGNRSLDLLAPQPLQLMLKTGLLTLRRYLRFWDVLINSRLGWQVTSWKEMLSIGGRLLNKPKEYFPRSEQQKYEREYHTIRQRDRETSGELMKRFLKLAGFVVANVARNIEILRERSSQNNKRNRDGDRIRPTTQDTNQRGYDQKGYDGRSYDRQGGNSNQKSWQNRGQQYNCSSGSSGQKGYPNYASSPLCDICGKLHPGKACHRVTGACFTCGSTGHMARDCPKNGRNGGMGNGNDNQPATKGRVFSSTKDQATNSSGTIFGNSLLEWSCCFFLFDTGATHSVVFVSFAKHISISPTLLNYTLLISTPMKSLVIIDHEYHNCPLRFDDKIHSANLFPLNMNDFDIKFWAWGAYGCILGNKQEAGINLNVLLLRRRCSEQLMHYYLVSLLSSPMRSVRMALGEVMTNLPPSTPSWKGLGNRSLDLLAPQPLQLMLKTGLLTLRRYSRSKQQKYEREYHTIRQRDGETSGELMKRFLRLAGFVVANAARNMEILCERSSQNNKRNRDGDRISDRGSAIESVGYDQMGLDGRLSKRIPVVPPPSSDIMWENLSRQGMSWGYWSCFTWVRLGIWPWDCPKNGETMGAYGCILGNKREAGI